MTYSGGYPRETQRLGPQAALSVVVVVVVVVTK